MKVRDVLPRVLLMSHDFEYLYSKNAPSINLFFTRDSSFQTSLRHGGRQRLGADTESYEITSINEA